MSLPPDQLERRRRSNIRLFKVFSIINVVAGLLLLAIDAGTLWWAALVLLLGGAYMGRAWFSRFTGRA